MNKSEIRQTIWLGFLAYLLFCLILVTVNYTHPLIIYQYRAMDCGDFSGGYEKTLPDGRCAFLDNNGETWAIVDRNGLSECFIDDCTPKPPFSYSSIPLIAFIFLLFVFVADYFEKIRISHGW